MSSAKGVDRKVWVVFVAARSLRFAVEPRVEAKEKCGLPLTAHNTFKACETNDFEERIQHFRSS